MRLRWILVTARNSARGIATDRGGSAVSLGFYAIVVVAISALWRAATETTGGAVVGYDATALTWYVIASEAAIVCIGIRLIEEIGDDIASGAVAVEMLRPASVVGVRVAREAGSALTRLSAFLVIGTIIGVVTVGSPPSLVGVMLAVPALVLAVLCNLSAQHAFAAAAFWVRDARSTWFLYQKLVFVLGGMLLPLEVLPPWLQAIALRLPFMAFAYVPARLASGHVEPQLLLVQLGWLVALGLAARAMFAAGERRLQVVGG